MRKTVILFLIGLSISTCGGAQEEPPQAAPEPAQEPECTTESLGDDAFLVLAEEEARQGSAADMSTLLAQMEQFGLALQEQADAIPSPPKALPAFPAIHMDLVTHTSTRTSKLENGKCIPDLDIQEHRHGGSYLCLPGWACAAALIQMNINDLATSQLGNVETPLSEEIYQRFFERGLANVGPMGDFVTEATDHAIADALERVFVDERLTKAFMEWMLKWAPQTLASHTPLMTRVIRELWEASNADETNVRGENLGNVFRAIKRISETQRKSVIYLRYWIVQMAKTLNMSEAYAWAGDVNAELRDSGLAYEKMYRSSIKDLLQ